MTLKLFYVLVCDSCGAETKDENLPEGWTSERVRAVEIGSYERTRLGRLITKTIHFCPECPKEVA